MSILSSPEIKSRIVTGGLIRNVASLPDGSPKVEPASYDLRAGTVVWKQQDGNQVRMEVFDPGKQSPMVTLSPGQMVIVITFEELSIPTDLCATVYSRNTLQKQNILALNAGHVDPGFDGQIIIRLINLGSSPWVLSLGAAIFTIVFHSIEEVDEQQRRDPRTAEETLSAARTIASQAFSNPLHDLYTDELEKRFARHDQELETRLRKELSDQFFRKDRVQVLAFEFAIALIAVLVLILKVPWGDLLKWVMK